MNKSQFYQSLNLQLKSLLDDQTNWITNLSQFSALLNMSLNDINWVGFYLNSGSGSLKLGPFQGKVACTDIDIGCGVCGTAADKRESIVVADVDQFKGHIACDSASRSEVVVPMLKDDQLIGVLDIDSPILSRFDNEDAIGLSQLLTVLIESTDWPAEPLIK